ncbi:MAG TPA: TIR domain-containing protein [Bradyrhizobium sp.]|uniref:TIR domain-containing protein n=1 Tax=Bradyrhizobium sp. TaxID=376 RepID=UPI002CAA058E|nr:TIR domain-containing protein [Bradyrhizobium sp.]HLZ02654.1 TIR domain-containing protein [Bradyrhizobium sp.]
MADNPFDLKNAGLLSALGHTPRGLLDLISTASTPPSSPTTDTLSGLLSAVVPAVNANPYSLPFGFIGPSERSASFPPPPIQPVTALGKVIASQPPSLASPSPLARAFGSLADSVAPPTRPAPPYEPAPVKRKGFFSFHYADIIRVNNVRNAWKIDCPGREDNRQFYDRSLWESVQRKNPEGLKDLIRQGMEHASVVCVLVGAETWSRPWVRYEIARSVIDKKGLLAVHINGLRHHQRLTSDAHGDNPLDFIGVGCPERGTYYLYERVGQYVLQYGQVVWQGKWQKYSKFINPVPVPKYMQAPVEGEVVPLSAVTSIYDYVGQQGHKNIGLWIDAAALRAGR